MSPSSEPLDGRSVIASRMFKAVALAAVALTPEVCHLNARAVEQPGSARSGVCRTPLRSEDPASAASMEPVGIPFLQEGEEVKATLPD